MKAFSIAITWVCACSGNGSAPTDSVAVDSAREPSCGMLDSTCGSAGMSSCCGSTLVPGGTFHRSYDGVDYFDMNSPATVSTFRLDKYEVTVGRFRKFVDAGMGTQANPPPAGGGARLLNDLVGQGGWEPAWNATLAADTSALVAALKCPDAQPVQAWTDVPAANENVPINCITWFEAFAFCVWDGGFLPTEAEWNYAAAGGNEHRAYPWSNPPSSVDIDCSYANHGSFVGVCANAPNGAVVRVGSKSPKGDGKWGHADLAGNVFEWTLDSYAIGYRTPCNDCAELAPTSARVARGGCFRCDPRTLRTAERRDFDARSAAYGVRCARSAL